MNTRELIDRIIEVLRRGEPRTAKPKPKPASKPKPKPKPKPPAQFTMYDSIVIGTIPRNAEAVAGYVGGKWPTYDALVRQFPKAKHLSIAVFPGEDADCLDIERGDARPDQAGAWVLRQKAKQKHRPCLYASLNTMPEVKADLAKNNIKRGEVRLWVAHYTYKPHIPSGFDACQWTDTALERNLDASLCQPAFL